MKVPSIMFKDDCIVYPFLGETPSGDGFDTGYPTKCRLEAKMKAIKTQQGLTYVQAGKVYFPLQDGNDTKIIRGTKLVVRSVEYFVKDVFPLDGFSPSHLECNLGDENKD